MDSSDHTYLRFREGEAQNYFDALFHAFGGEISGNVYEVNRGGTKIRMTVLAGASLNMWSIVSLKVSWVGTSSVGKTCTVGKYAVARTTCTATWHESFPVGMAAGTRGINKMIVISTIIICVVMIFCMAGLADSTPRLIILTEGKVIWPLLKYSNV